MTISSHHQQRMQSGRHRKQRQQRAEAKAKVDAYFAWVKAGSDFKTIPPLPTDAEFKAARRSRDEDQG